MFLYFVRCRRSIICADSYSSASFRMYVCVGTRLLQPDFVGDLIPVLGYVPKFTMSLVHNCEILLFILHEGLLQCHMARILTHQAF